MFRLCDTRRPVHFSEDEDIVRDIIHLEEDLINLEEDGVGGNDGPLACMRRAVWGMLYADDAGITSTSATRFATMTTAIMTIFKAVGLTVSEKKTETMLLQTLEENDAATDTRGPDTPGSTARHRTRRSEVSTGDLQQS